MAHLHVSLFGKTILTHGGHPLSGFGAGKVQELFCYLLLHRQQPTPREALASLLWQHQTTSRSKAYLRRALWKLKSNFKEQLGEACDTVLLTSPRWVQCNPAFDLWLDVEVLEQAFASAEGVAGRDLNSQQVETLERAVALYEGDLLENYYQEWCLYERERLRHLYLVLLDKVAAFHEAHRHYERALSFTERILSQDRARECTHRQVMRLKRLAGDRTGALRQYTCCVQVLREELDIAPGASTQALFEQIKAGGSSNGLGLPSSEEPACASAQRPASLDPLRKALDALIEAQQRVREEMSRLERVL